ncbi:FMN-binding negative transcriptional regulator [Halalkalibacter lacteus]|uniref:FMN-binding negative transcriptional regulator n=1 Tax=Halalkalibacter lacteus TaxID=3090663 RepID=UPI002FC5D6A7
MYIPKAFEVSNKYKLYDFIQSNSFGILFSQVENGPLATHLPFLVDENVGEGGILVSHMAKLNPHWENLNNKEVLVVFSGPHAYISPTWYNEGNTVPTWNYVAVHVYGTVRIIDKKEEMVELLSKTVDFYEASMPNPWNAQFDSKFMDGLMNGIVGLEISINRIEGKWKLNQNHSIERQQNLVNGLKTSNEYNSAEIARIMQENIDANNKN